MKFRWAQQLRLWIYILVEILIISQILSHKASGIEFFIFMLVGSLFYLEICPVCGHLAWWETNRWPNAFWISARCKRDSLGE